MTYIPHQALVPPSQTPAADYPQPPSSSGGQRWRCWERSCLIDSLADGLQIEQVASKLGRTADAVRREFERLRSGQTPCPAAEEAKLERLKATFAGPPAARKRLYRTSLLDLRAQYRHIARKLEELGEKVREWRAVNLIHLAVAVKEGRFPSSLLQSSGLSLRTCTAVAKLAEDLQAGRGGEGSAAFLAAGTYDMPEQAGESALDDQRWENMTLASLGINAGICSILAGQIPPVITVGDWENLVESGSENPLPEAHRVGVEHAVDAWRKGLPR